MRNPLTSFSNSQNFPLGIEAYRYGMNGQEKDEELGTGVTCAESWEYDAKLGRRWNRDPIIKRWESPYATFSNSPIIIADPLGSDGEGANDENCGEAPAPTSGDGDGQGPKQMEFTVSQNISETDYFVVQKIHADNTIGASDYSVETYSWYNEAPWQPNYVNVVSTTITPYSTPVATANLGIRITQNASGQWGFDNNTTVTPTYQNGLGDHSAGITTTTSLTPSPTDASIANLQITTYISGNPEELAASVRGSYGPVSGSIGTTGGGGPNTGFVTQTVQLRITTDSQNQPHLSMVILESANKSDFSGVKVNEAISGRPEFLEPNVAPADWTYNTKLMNLGNGVPIQ